VCTQSDKRQGLVTHSVLSVPVRAPNGTIIAVLEAINHQDAIGSVLQL